MKHLLAITAITIITCNALAEEITTTTTATTTQSTMFIGEHISQNETGTCTKTTTKLNTINTFKDANLELQLPHTTQSTTTVDCPT